MENKSGREEAGWKISLFPFFVTWLHLCKVPGVKFIWNKNFLSVWWWWEAAGKLHILWYNWRLPTPIPKNKQKKKTTQQWHEVIKPLTRSFELFLTFLDIFPDFSVDMKFLLHSYPVFNYKCRSSFCNLWKFALIKSNSYNHEVCLVTAAGSSNRYAALDEIICPMFLYNSIIWQHGAQYNESLLSIGILRTN